MWTLRSGEKLKTLVFEDTWKCDSAKVFGQKKSKRLATNKVERKSIFVRLKEAGKWWEGQSRDDWLFARNAFLVFFSGLKPHIALQSFGLKFASMLASLFFNLLSIYPLWDIYFIATAVVWLHVLCIFNCTLHKLKSDLHNITFASQQPSNLLLISFRNNFFSLSKNYFGVVT